MKSEGRVAAVNIYEARQAIQQLSQYPRLQRDFEELDQAIALLPLAQKPPPRLAYYEPFANILLTDISPTWTRVSEILSDIFGQLGQANEQEVPLGLYGIEALRRTVGRAIGNDKDVGEVRHWLDIVTRSVYLTTEIIARNPLDSNPPIPPNGASASTPNLLPTLPTEQSKSPTTFRSASPSPSPKPKLEAKIEQSAMETLTRAFSPLRRLIASRGRSEPFYDDDSPLSSLSDSEEEADVSQQLDEERPRKRARGSSNSQVLQLNTDETDAAKKRLQDEVEEEWRVRQAELGERARAEFIGRKRQGGRNRPWSMISEDWIVRDTCTSIPPNVDLSPASDFGAPASVPFRRSDLTGDPTVTVHDGMGQVEPWDRLKNNLCLTPDMKLYSMPPLGDEIEMVFRPGQPIVFISRADVCSEVAEAISTMKRVGKGAATRYVHKVGKEWEFIHVFIRADARDWRYMGDYVIAWNGSNNSKHHETLDGLCWESYLTLKTKFGVHAMSTDRSGYWPAGSLKDWGFKAKNWTQAEKELQAPGFTRTRRHVKYLALRCIGWDETSMKSWTQNREKRLAKELKGK